MSVEKVNGKMNVSFGERANVQPGKTKKTPKEIKDGKKKLAMALGALAVAGAVTAGVVIAVKKRKLNNFLIKNVIDESAYDINNVAKNYFNSFDDFKKIGTFDKGKALIDGKGFSGVIKNVGKDGQIRQVQYENGLLSSVNEVRTKYHDAPFPTLRILKKYDYEKDGTKTIFDFVKKQYIRINPDKSIEIP